MKLEHFNLESVTDLGTFYFQFVGNAVGGGQWWGVNTGDRCLFHIRAAHGQEVEAIFNKQKNYPYYCPTEKDHFFFFEDRIYHVTPSLVDPLAEMIILYFSRMTQKLKPEIKHIQREFGDSLAKFDRLLKEKAERAKFRALPSSSVTASKPALTSTSQSGEKDVPSFIGKKEATTSTARAATGSIPAGTKDGDAQMTEKDLQKERMKERRRRLGLPDDIA